MNPGYKDKAAVEADRGLTEAVMHQMADVGFSGDITTKPGPEPNSLTLGFETGAVYHYWPKSKWWNRMGGGQGRGMDKLLLNSKKPTIVKPRGPAARVRIDGKEHASLAAAADAGVPSKDAQWQPIGSTEGKTDWPAARVFLTGIGLGFATGLALASFLGAF